MVSLLSFNVRILVFIIKLYQKVASPLFMSYCRFTPTCSLYGIEALNRFGITKGCFLIIKRILKCHPLHSGGIDQVPLKKSCFREH